MMAVLSLLERWLEDRGFTGTLKGSSTVVRMLCDTV